MWPVVWSCNDQTIESHTSHRLMDHTSGAFSCQTRSVHHDPAQVRWNSQIWGGRPLMWTQHPEHSGRVERLTRGQHDPSLRSQTGKGALKLTPPPKKKKKLLWIPTTSGLYGPYAFFNRIFIPALWDGLFSSKNKGVSIQSTQYLVQCTIQGSWYD